MSFACQHAACYVPSMSRYALCGKIVATNGNREVLTSIMRKASNHVSKMDACQLYPLFEDVDDKNTLWITELWTNKEAHDRSLQEPAVRATIGEAKPYLDFGMSQARLTPLFGVGMPRE